MPLSVAFALIAEAIVFAILLFGGAGTMAWPAGWAFMALFFVPGTLISAQIARDDPALMDERMKFLVQPGQPVWDRIFMGIVSVLFVGWLLVMGLDRRFGWTHVPTLAQVLGGAAAILGWLGLSSVFRTNTFLAPVVKIQSERGQHVISTGPYAIIRHPMYSLSVLMMGGLAFVSGSWIGVAGVAALTITIGWRARGEEKLLRASLEGYDEYAARVRYRLLPGVW